MKFPAMLLAFCLGAAMAAAQQGNVSGKDEVFMRLRMTIP